MALPGVTAWVHAPCCFPARADNSLKLAHAIVVNGHDTNGRSVAAEAVEQANLLRYPLQQACREWCAGSKPHVSRHI